MKIEKNDGLGKIRRGELVYYYPLKLETALTFEELCEKLDKSVSDSLSKCHKAITGMLKQAISKGKGKENVKNNKDTPVFKCMLEDSTFIVEETKLGIHHGCTQAYLNQVADVDESYERNKRIYGSAFVSRQYRVILPPLNVQLNNEKKVWLQAILVVFSNKMAVLKIRLPLLDVETDHLKDNCLDEYVSSIIGGCFAPEEKSDVAFSDIHKLYLDRISKIKGIKKILQCKSLSNLVLADCDGLPLQKDSIPVSVQKDLFEIIAAPVTERNNYSYTAKAKEYLKQYAWESTFFISIANTTGGSISFFEKSIIDGRKKRLAEDLGVDALNADELDDLYHAIVFSVDINTEFAYLLLALKKINAEYIFLQKQENLRQIDEIQAEYNNNLIFISELQNSCMGTVYEQLQAYEEKMPFYINKDLINERMQAIDRIRENESSRHQENYQTLLGVFGIILTAVFGLSAIRETLTILRNMTFLAEYDIPYATIDGVSIALWVLLLVFIIILFSKRRWKK